MQEDRKKKEEILMIVPDKGFVLKMRCSLREKELGDVARNEKFNLRMQQLEPWDRVKAKFTPAIKLYLNVCHSDRVLLPLDANKNEIGTFTNATIKNIACIPHSLQQPLVRTNTEQDKVFYYTIVLNSKVYQSLMQVNAPYLMNLSVSLLQERLSSNMNPLLKEYNPNEYARLVWYAVDKSTIEKHKTKVFKVAKQSEPTKILLEAGSDKQQSRDVNKGKPAEPKVEYKQQKEEE